MADSCFTPVNFVGLRLTQLNADGTVHFGSDVTYVTNSGIAIDAKPDEYKAKSFEQVDGGGNLCGSYDADCNRTKGYELGLELCRMEFALAHLACGGALEEISGQIVGYADPDPIAACPNGVVVEAWAIAWDGDQQAAHPVSGRPAYYRYRYPKVLWTQDADKNNNGFGNMKLKGKAIPNSRAGLGPLCDWPAEVVGPRAIDLVDSIPTGSCSFANLVACS